MVALARLYITVLTLVAVSSDVQTYAQSIKYRLIMKLNTQIEINLRDEFFKPNQFMIWQCGATVKLR